MRLKNKPAYDNENNTYLHVSFNSNNCFCFVLASLSALLVLPVSANKDNKLNAPNVASRSATISNNPIAILPKIDDYLPMTYGQLGNHITIAQEGSSLTVNALQQGQHNYMELSQIGINDGVNGLNSLQIGSGNVQVASQSGINAQSNDGLAITASFKQNGHDNGLWIDQDGGTLAASIEQLGSANKTYASQNGEQHLLTVNQNGFNNSATAHQLGLSHTLTINQIGNNNTALAKQEGAAFHQASIYQQGNENTAILIQNSADTLSPANISQIGNGMTIMVLRY